jgi:hypothetical protein
METRKFKEGKRYNGEELWKLFHKNKWNEHRDEQLDEKGKIVDEKIVEILGGTNFDIKGMNFKEFKEGVEYSNGFCNRHKVMFYGHSTAIDINEVTIKGGSSGCCIPSFIGVLDVFKQYEQFLSTLVDLHETNCNMCSNKSKDPSEKTTSTYEIPHEVLKIVEEFATDLNYERNLKKKEEKHPVSKPKKPEPEMPEPEKPKPINIKEEIRAAQALGF